MKEETTDTIFTMLIGLAFGLLLTFILGAILFIIFAFISWNNPADTIDMGESIRIGIVVGSIIGVVLGLGLNGKLD